MDYMNFLHGQLKYIYQYLISKQTCKTTSFCVSETRERRSLAVCREVSPGSCWANGEDWPESENGRCLHAVDRIFSRAS